MKTSYFLLLTVCASSVYAGPPPRLTDISVGSYEPIPAAYSDYNSVYGYTAAPSDPVMGSLNRLQTDITQLKTKVANQSKDIANLSARQARLEGLRTGSQGSPYPANLSTTNPYPYIPDPHYKASPDEKARYDYAYSLFRTGAYDQAIAEFQAIIKMYPKGEYADNSQYWTGEALLKKGDKAGALRTFDGVVYGYPKSAKVPDALLKLGMTLLSTGNKPKAREYFDYLIATYPRSPSADIAYTKKIQAGL